MEPVFILVRPQLGENIGSSARAMLNFGLNNLRIVQPRDGWPNPRAKALASGAGVVLDNAIIFDNVRDSCKDLQVVFAASARKRKLEKQEIPLNQAIIETKNLIQKGLKIGFLFGPEQSGLSNEDMSHSDKLVFVNTSINCKSINLSQCVLLFAYEWFNNISDNKYKTREKKLTRSASREELDELLKRLRQNLKQKNFFWPPDKEKSLILYLENLFSKFPLNSSDIRFLHGIIRTLAEKKDRKNLE